MDINNKYMDINMEWGSGVGIKNEGAPRGAPSSMWVID